MSKPATKTNNSFFESKVKLRIDNLPDKPEISVLDCFAGDGLIWRTIRARATNKKITVLSIDKKSYTDQINLMGNNMKFLTSMDLSEFDVIDLDAYGCPIKQLRAILNRSLRSGLVIYITFIQSLYGALPSQFLSELGYTKKMIDKIPSLFNRDGQEKLFLWLALYGFEKVKFYTTKDKKKTYLCTKID